MQWHNQAEVGVTLQVNWRQHKLQCSLSRCGMKTEPEKLVNDFHQTGAAWSSGHDRQEAICLMLGTSFSRCLFVFVKPPPPISFPIPSLHSPLFDTLKLVKIHAYLTKMETPLSTNPLITDIQTSNFKETKHYFVLIIKHWIQHHIPGQCFIFQKWVLSL